MAAKLQLAAIEENREELVQLIDFNTLKTELLSSTYSPLVEFLQASVEQPKSDEENVLDLLQYICSGNGEAALAFLDALEKESSHEGHGQAASIIKDALSIADVQSSVEDNTLKQQDIVSSVLQQCTDEIKAKLDFNFLLPLLMRKGLISMDQFSSMQLSYMPSAEKADSLVKTIASLGIKGLVDLIDVLEGATHKESHSRVAVIIKEKARKAFSGMNEQLLSEEQRSMLISTSIITGAASSLDISGNYRSGSTSSLASAKKDRVAILISMETYYNSTDVTRRIPAKLGNGQLVSERRVELENMFHDMGCGIVTITEVATVDNIFGDKAIGLCSSNSVVFVVVIGQVYMFKDEMGLLLNDKVLLPIQSQCIMESQLSTAISSLPSPYVSVIIDGIHGGSRSRVKLENPWKLLCPFNSRVAMLYTELSESSDQDVENGVGSLTEILLQLLKELNKKGLANKGITHHKLFVMISALWNKLHKTTPCVKGDIDRDVFGTINTPLPHHIMGTITSNANIFLITAGVARDYQKGANVKLCHIFRPDVILEGIVESSQHCTSVVMVKDRELWNRTRADVKQSFLDGDDDYGSFIYVFTNIKGISMDIHVSNTHQAEIASFLREAWCDVEVTPPHYSTKRIVRFQEDNNVFSVTSTNIKYTYPVTNLQLAKSLLMRVINNELVRVIQNTNEMGVACHAYIHPSKGTDLVKEQMLRDGLLYVDSSPCHKTCPPQGIVCDDEENQSRYWSPMITNTTPSPFVQLNFVKNKFLQSIEVRGLSSFPQYVPSGYNIEYTTLISLCNDRGEPTRRFDASALRNKGGTVSIKLQSLDPWNKEMVLHATKGPFMLTITPFTMATDKGTIIAMKLLSLTDKGDVMPLRSYQVHQNYGLLGYSITPQPSNNTGEILVSDKEWVTVKYPLNHNEFTLVIPRGMPLTRLVLNHVESSDEFQPPMMIELTLCTLYNYINVYGTPPSIRCSSYLPEYLKLPSLIPVNKLMFFPVPQPPENKFKHPICLQVQLKGFDRLTDIEVFEGEILQCVVNYTQCDIYHVTVFCIEDTGSIDVIANEKCHPKNGMYIKFIKMFIPHGYHSDVIDDYLIVVSNYPLHLMSLQQMGGVNYCSSINYNAKLLKPITQETESGSPGWCTVSHYRVKVKHRR